MKELTLESASKELEKLENDWRYWYSRMEQIVSLVLPKATSIESDKVDGGKRVDTLLKYCELKNELQIDITLRYIEDKIASLNIWIENELKRLDKYNEIEKSIVFLREKKKVKDKYNGRIRSMTWNEIAKEVHYSERSVRYFYQNAMKKRECEDKDNGI